MSKRSKRRSGRRSPERLARNGRWVAIARLLGPAIATAMTSSFVATLTSAVIA